MFERLKKLLSQTAIYGLSSILGRLINFVLVPLHTGALSKTEFGTNTDIYTLIAFLIVIFTYGMETTFFRFSEKKEFVRDTVYSTTLVSIFGSTLFFLGIISLFFDDILGVLRYEKNPSYIVFLFGILAIDTIAAIPFARLRANNKPGYFVIVKFALIGANVLLNLFFFKYCPWALENQSLGHQFISTWFDAANMVQYIFIANILASSVMLLLLVPEMFSVKWKFDPKLWKKMLIYSLPLMISGLAGVANEMLDRQFIKYLLPENISKAQLGIYGAVYKISIFLVLFNQAFRYAAEPFFFATEKEKNAKDSFALILKYFTVVMTVGYVFIICYLDLFKHFIDEKFWEGLYIVPILLLANVFLGINTNLSIWYKLTEQTRYGIVITGVGLIFTLGLNIFLIPKIGYEGAAWATLVSYFAMTATSYLLGQIHYKVNYPIGKMLVFIALAIIAVWFAWHYSNSTFVPQTLIFIAYLLILMVLERKDIRELKTRLNKK